MRSRSSFMRRKLSRGRYTSPRASTTGGKSPVRVGDAPHLAQVVGDVLPGLAVAAGRAEHEFAVAVHQAHGQAVDFQLGDHAEPLAVQQVGDAAMPRLQVLAAEGVGQAEHGYGVFDLGEPVGGAAADHLGGRVGGAALRVGGFQVAQFPHQGVVLAVADDRGVVVVVPVVVEPDLVAQLLGALDGRQVAGVVG